jgi:ATP-dependent DNA helicase RecQ
MVDGSVEAVPRGSLVDVRVRGEALGGSNLRAIGARLKARTRAAYDQIRDVEGYANLTTCRREHLLRHFGDDEEVAPCGGCDVCLGEVGTVVRGEEPTLTAPLATGRSSVPVESVGPAGGPTDGALFERLRSWRAEQARGQGVPAYVVLHNSHLEEISRLKPTSVHELGRIKGIGLRRAARYGEEILALVRGEEQPAPSPEARPHEPTHAGPPTDVPRYRVHVATAGRLLRTGRPSEAVPELARALEIGGEEAKGAVDELLFVFSKGGGASDGGEEKEPA